VARRLLRKSRQEWIVRIKTTYGCQLCNEDRIYCLTFHHFDKKTKNRKVCKCLSNFSKKVIREEANKCVVLCLNCHALVEENISHVSKDMMCEIDDHFMIKIRKRK